MFAGIAGYFLVPVYGWRAMFLVGLVPAILMIPLRWSLTESPRCCDSKAPRSKSSAPEQRRS